VKYSRLYYNPHQTKNTEPLTPLDSLQRGPYFPHQQYPTADEKIGKYDITGMPVMMHAFL